MRGSTSSRNALRSRLRSSLLSSSMVGESVSIDIAFDVRPRDIDERPHQQQSVGIEATRRRKCRQALEAGAAHPLDQEGLDAIVAVMRAANDLCADVGCDVCQCLVTRLTRCCLETAPRPLHRDPTPDESKAQGRGAGLAMRQPRVGVATDAVMHVHGDHFAPGPCRASAPVRP